MIDVLRSGFEIVFLVVLVVWFLLVVILIFIRVDFLLDIIVFMLVKFKLINLGIVIKFEIFCIFCCNMLFVLWNVFSIGVFLLMIFNK